MENSVNNANLFYFTYKESEERRAMYNKNVIQKLRRVIKQMKLLKNFLNLFQKMFKKNLEEPMIGSEFVPDSIDLLYYHLQKVGLKRSGSYIDSPEWLKNKKATINPKNNDGNCFQYVLTVALNHQNIEKNPSNNIENQAFY